MSQNVYDASRRAAGGYSTVGPDAGMTSAMGLFGNMAGYGDVGGRALSGDQGSIDSMMNPYLQQVLGGYNDQFAQDSAMLRKNNNDAATQAGAFGGDRAALEQGATQGELGRAHLSQVAGLLHGGYNDAMQRAGGLANLGLTAGGAQFQGGQAMRDIAQQQANPEVMRQQLLTAGLQGGNVGNASDSTYTKTGAMQNILGGAATLGGLFGGGGWSGLAGLFGGGSGGAGGYDATDPSQNMFAPRKVNYNGPMSLFG